MGDSMIFDMSNMTEGQPQVFVKKDVLSILDGNSGNYLGGQSIIDTSQLSNSNKYMAYREGYLAIPLTLAAQDVRSDKSNKPLFLNAQTGGIGLKNWFGHIVHSMTLDYAGTTIIQNTPLQSIWSHFNLMTTMSLQDVLTNGPTIGFYPDNATSFILNLTNAESAAGTVADPVPMFPGVCNTMNVENHCPDAQNLALGSGNEGMIKRQKYWSFDKDETAGGAQAIDPTNAFGQKYSTAIGDAAINGLRMSTVVKKKNATASITGAETGYLQYGILAIIRLKDLHPFFAQTPLLKGVFMRLTLNLNQPSFTLKKTSSDLSARFDLDSITSPLGGINPILVAATNRMQTGLQYGAGSSSVGSVPGGNGFLASDADVNSRMIVTLNVGNTVQNNSFTERTTAANLDQSIMLYVPAYTFNPSFEEAYLSSSVKTIVYTDIYQYTTPVVEKDGNFNFLLTNGIANIKSVLVFPVYQYMVPKEFLGTGSSSISKSTSPILSPFDTCPCTTSPLSHISNFNVVVAGQNMIYNTQKYAYEEFLNQLSGCNSINANLVNGLTSGLINQQDFMSSQCAYYVQCSRMLPVDESVPKSVSIMGKNESKMAMTYICFIEYGVQVSVDILTGSRV